MNYCDYVGYQYYTTPGRKMENPFKKSINSTGFSTTIESTKSSKDPFPGKERFFFL